MYEPKSKEWFTKRIGKRIYRDDTGCGCSTCNDVVENGLIVDDEEHAEYLFWIDNDFGADGRESNYRDEL